MKRSWSGGVEGEGGGGGAGGVGGDEAEGGGKRPLVAAAETTLASGTSTMLPPQEYLELKDVRSGCKSAKMQPPLPGFDPFAASGAELLELSVRMLPGLSPGSLRPFLTAVRALYNPNPYHNFKQ